MFGLMLVYCLLYAPTLALTNSIAMINLKDSEEEFGGIRVWGTLGWIAAGWTLTGWRWLADRPRCSVGARATCCCWPASPRSSWACSRSPCRTRRPQKEGVKPWAFLESLKMLKAKQFAIFVGITFVVATELRVLLHPDGAVPRVGQIGVSSTWVAVGDDHRRSSPRSSSWRSCCRAS